LLYTPSDTLVSYYQIDIASASKSFDGFCIINAPFVNLDDVSGNANGFHPWYLFSNPDSKLFILDEAKK